MGLLRSLLKGLFGARSYGTRCRTLRGEIVKSQAEKIIADYLYRNGIRYKYEHSAKTNAWIFSKKISRPDFYLPDYDVYVEYWGLVDADSSRTRSRYSREMRWKMAQYHKHGIKFISIYPSNLEGLDWVFRAKFKDITGISLPSKSS